MEGRHLAQQAAELFGKMERGDLRQCCVSSKDRVENYPHAPERAIVAFDFMDSHFISEAFNAGSETSRCHTRD